MPLEKKQRKRLIPVIVILFLFVCFIIWGISNFYYEKHLLKTERCKHLIILSDTSYRAFLGNSFVINTIYYYQVNNNNFRAANTAFCKPVPKNFPILIKYVENQPDVYEFLWDSIFIYNGFKIKYFSVENQELDYTITKINTTDIGIKLKPDG